MLIECPECKNQVSEFAESCPHCGYRITSPATPNTLSSVKTICDGADNSAKHESEEHKQYAFYLKEMWRNILLFLGMGLLFSFTLGAIGLIPLASFGLLITVVWSIRMIPTRGKYEKAIQDEKFIKDIKNQLMDDKKTVLCPKCKSEISVDFMKCPDCHLEIGELIDAARGK